MRIVAVLAVCAALASCSDDGGQDDRITRIDGPAQVDDDVTPEQAPQQSPDE